MSLIQEILKEMAAGGSTGAGSVAVNTDRPRHADKQWRDDIIKAKTPTDGNATTVNPSVVKKRVEDAKKKLKKKRSFVHRVKKYLGLAEASDMNDVVSRLKDMENRNIDDTVTYGLEDDDGNLMKISVRAEKSKEFEQRLSYELSNAVNMNAQLFNNSDSDEKPKSNSMAELLFRLKDEFEIVDVEFPKIPKNAIYKVAGAEITKAKNDGMGKTDLDNPGDYDSEDGDLDSMFADDGSGEDMGDDNLDGIGDSGDMGAGDTGPDGKPMDQMADDDSVSDFDTGGDAGGAESLLQNIISMLKSDADAKKAQAEAEAEKARALQAEYSAKAAKASIEQQAELLSMEEEIKNQKRKEKEAKRISDLAKFRVKQTNAMPLESLQDKRNLIETVLFEFDEFDTVQTLLRQKTVINQQYRITPGDDAATVDYKNKARMQAMRELNARIQRAKLRTKFNSQQQIKNAMAAKNNPNAQNQQNPNMNPNNVQNNQGQVNNNQQAGRMV